MTLQPLASHAEKMTKAVSCLLENNFREAGIMLFYAAIDQMAWLSIMEEDVRGEHFMKWVDEHMLARNKAGLEAVSPGDLWGARCGYLHNASPDSRSFRNGVAAHKLAYTYGPVVGSSLVPGVLVVRIEDLISSFLYGVLWFNEKLESDPPQALIANTKLASMSKDWAINS